MRLRVSVCVCVWVWWSKPQFISNESGERENRYAVKCTWCMATILYYQSNYYYLRSNAKRIAAMTSFLLVFSSSLHLKSIECACGLHSCGPAQYESGPLNCFHIYTETFSKHLFFSSSFSRSKKTCSIVVNIVGICTLCTSHSMLMMMTVLRW